VTAAPWARSSGSVAAMISARRSDGGSAAARTRPGSSRVGAGGAALDLVGTLSDYMSEHSLTLSRDRPVSR